MISPRLDVRVKDGLGRWFVLGLGANAMGWSEVNSRETHVADVVILVLADRRVLFAEGFGMLLDAEADLAVLGLAHHSSQAVEVVAQYRPAVLVVEARLPDRGRAETLAAAKAASPAATC